MKVDDDSYMVMENVRHMLYQYKQKTALYFGQRLTGNESLDGYIYARRSVHVVKKSSSKVPLSRKFSGPKICTWVENFSKKTCLLINNSLLGLCLTNKSIFVDTRDNRMQMRFLMFGVEKYF